jgi:hypothetical protein
VSQLRHLDDLLHDELAVLGREYLLAGQLMDRSGMPHLISAYGREVMGEIAIDEWMGASPIYTRRMQRLLKFGAGDVATIFKGMQFDIGAPPEFMDFRYKVIDARHGEFWLDHCGALMDVEPMGDQYVTTMCHTIEDPTFDATATATSSHARVRPIHRPPRVPTGREPHCHWTVEINEEFEALPDPEPAGPIGATRLAALSVPTIEVTEPSTDGWDDYTSPVDPDLQLEQFSTAALRALCEEFCVQSHLLAMSFLMAIERRYSTEAAVDIGAKQFAGIAGLTAERLRLAFGWGTALSDIAQMLELHPAFHPRAYIDFRVELDTDTDTETDDGEGRLVLRLGPSPALEEVGRDSWITILGDGHDAALQAAVQAIDPCARVHAADPAPGDVAAWRVVIGEEPAKESSEVALTRFSTGADFQFVATPVTLAARAAASTAG